MKIYSKDPDELLCDMQDGNLPFKLGWVQHDDNRGHYCLCMWMVHGPDPRSHLLPVDYPEQHPFATEDEAYQALSDAAVIAVIGGFRGR
jgi:hypothetical protein